MTHRARLSGSEAGTWPRQYEGRGWRGFHHHATLCIAAYAFLISERSLTPPSWTRDRLDPAETCRTRRLPPAQNSPCGPSGAWLTQSPPSAPASPEPCPRSMLPTNKSIIYDTVRLDHPSTVSFIAPTLPHFARGEVLRRQYDGSAPRCPRFIKYRLRSLCSRLALSHS